MKVHVPRTLACFRLLTEPASLKPPDGDPPVGAAGEFPAPHRAGLIEATTCGAASNPAMMFPAPHRAGLIEASVVEYFSSPPAAFPAPHRAGLIEAPSCGWSWTSGRKFPAPHRAGLIEAATGRCCGRPRRCSFRLLTEPASLKPEPSRAEPCRARPFPAPHRAGLIEAAAKRTF